MQSEPYGEQSGSPRRGRRDNGLDAERFIPLLDVDPRIGEHLLDVLRMAGIGAYLEPAMDVEPSTRAVLLPAPPTDRLWVDGSRRHTAYEIVSAETGGMVRDTYGDDVPSRGLPDPAEEWAWREIVARFDRDSTSMAVPPWPVSEDIDGPAGRREAPGATPGSGGEATTTNPERNGATPGGDAASPESAADTERPTAAGAAPPEVELFPSVETEPPGARSGGTPSAPPSGDVDGASTRSPHPATPEEQDETFVWPPPGGTRRRGGRRRATRRSARRRGRHAAGPGRSRFLEEEHYDPPAPPPLPRPSKPTVAALVLIVVGASLLLWPELLGFGTESALALGVLALLSAGGLLLLRLREDRFDDPDDGAVV